MTVGPLVEFAKHVRHVIGAEDRRSCRAKIPPELHREILHPRAVGEVGTDWQEKRFTSWPLLRLFGAQQVSGTWKSS